MIIIPKWFCIFVTNNSKLNFMKFLFLAISMLLMAACCNNHQESCDNKKTEVVLPEGEFTYNLPCRVVHINPDKPGKAIVWLWLHGGVRDYKKHDFFEFNHLDCCDADEIILKYLKDNGIKAIALFPVCHKANNPEPVTWIDCYDDVKHIINDYVNKGLVDTKRIYVTGSSDGGRGTWDYAEHHPEMFAAAIAMSCSEPRKVDIPIYFFGTSDETDCSEEIARLIEQGVNVKYKYCPEYKHGGDAAECTPELLQEFFSYTK